MSNRLEFARPVLLTRLGGEPFHQHIVADEAERVGLARRFELLALDRLEAEVELVREVTGTILLTASITAEFAQPCIVTLNPVVGRVSERFQLRYGPAEAELDVSGSGGEDPAFEPVAGELIDIGEAVAQEFSLALPPFPRAPGAAIEEGAMGTLGEGTPFAALTRLVRREQR
jgi:uncharacterized metal-binding protein YceD (DUF177 family)